MIKASREFQAFVKPIGSICNIFDEWIRRDIGQVKIQVFEEAVSNVFAARVPPAKTDNFVRNSRRPMSLCKY